MNELLWTLIGSLIPPLITWILSLINKPALVKLLAGLIAKLLRDPQTRNKTENEVGTLLMEIGAMVVETTPDNDEVRRLVEEIKDRILVLKQDFKAT